ncbi:Nif3-like dinuclear metal center hexameric protein [Parenemella sanctibonifatiensis]|uniref:GTP cyclohydrolase 1 type 2 homolog n=2 Tax=Parenemella sanctibonifatiensis TaxID=2016505 RepID=A0A255ETJ9_9ACTN|nr:Nif3-like dinuclear metal center hexameric protein [Parenemella sanctibonifatiensis]
MSPMATVSSVIAALEEQHPTHRAESWDQVGLAAGDPASPVSHLLLAVDPTLEVVREAARVGAELIITHHPLLLRGIHAVTATDPKGEILRELMRHDIALYTAHTNADVGIAGVSEALATAVGLTDLTPLAPQPAEALVSLATQVPRDSADAVREALAEAGAGSLGDYRACSFSVTGTGRFLPVEGAEPTIGTVGTPEEVEEERIEVVLPQRLRRPVLSALLASHPYEEPAWTMTTLEQPLGEIGLGRVGRLPEPLTAAAFAEQVSAALPETITGVRLAGDPERMLSRIAVMGGAGDSHLDQARAAGVDAYLTSDLRHHPASEFIAHDDAPVLLDVAHWAAEWTWLPMAAQALSAAVPGLKATVSTLRTDPWTLRV